MTISPYFKKVVVFSPHLDDAILDCCDHILEFKKNGLKVEVISIFTLFKAGILTATAQAYLHESGFETSEEMEKCRAKEDRQAMNSLQIQHTYLNFTDGGFRTSRDTHRPIYKNFKNLFSSQISQKETTLMKNLELALRTFNQKNTLFLIPYGIGNHVDHQLVRFVSEKIFKKNSLYFYLDFPYSLDRRNWRLKAFMDFILAKEKSIKGMTHLKRKTTFFYKSQMPVLFKDKVNYPEIIFSKAKFF